MGIQINGEWINNIRYADDTVVFGNKTTSFQKMINKEVDVSQSYGLSLNINKNNYMIISKKKQIVEE